MQTMFSDNMINFFFLSFISICIYVLIYVLLTFYIRGLYKSITKIREQIEEDLKYNRDIIIGYIEKRSKR